MKLLPVLGAVSLLVSSSAVLAGRRFSPPAGNIYNTTATRSDALINYWVIPHTQLVNR